MAYQSDADYRAIQNALKKQMEATTNASERAQLQGQYDAADASRTEKLASNLSQYGKWASDSELDSAAGLMAQNQIGTGFETQKANVNQSYDTAKQSAQNSALSRGMARSSFVQDREANLDSKRANALSDVDAAKALSIQNAKQNILNNYQTNVDNKLAAEKNEYAQNIGAYYSDFQQEINNVMGNNDPSDDWKAQYLQAARQQKIQGNAELNMKYGDFSNAGSIGLSPEALANAQKIYEINNPKLFMPTAATYAAGSGGYQSTVPTKEPETAGFAATGDASIRNEVYGMMAGGATGTQIMTAARKQYGGVSQKYKEYEHAVNVAGAGARRR